MLAKFTLNLQLQGQVITGKETEAARDTGTETSSQGAGADLAPQEAPGPAHFTSYP